MPASDVPPLGQRIRAERLRREISLRALAREVGVSASMISQLETGKAQPSVSTLYAITSILGMSIQDVFSPGPPDRSAGNGSTGDGSTGDGAAGGGVPAPIVPRPTTVLEALGAARVETLLVKTGFTAPGFLDGETGMLSAEQDRPSGGALEHVDDIVERAIEKAIEQSAEVIGVRHHDDLGPLGGIGAVLRY